MYGKISLNALNEVFEEYYSIILWETKCSACLPSNLTYAAFPHTNQIFR